jgi:hypothetical protein
MNRDDIQKLLGGYATGTLTAEEQQTLFEAALDDQELFDALAREQALRDLLRDPAAKTQLIAALDQRHLGWYERLVRGWRPLAAAAAMAGVGAIAIVMWQGARSPRPVLVAQFSPPPAGATSAMPAPAEPSATPPAANLEREPAATRDISAPAIREKDAPPGRLARESPAKVAVGRSVLDEDRRAKEKQVAPATERQEAADKATPSLSKGTAAPLPVAPPAPRTFASGFRDGVGQVGGNGDLGGAPPVAQPLAESKAPALFRSVPGNAAGGVGGGAAGGVIGGVVGAKPVAAPPPPPTLTPTKAEAQLKQSAQSQAAQSGPAQSAQGQQGAPPPSAQFQSSQPLQSQLERTQLAQSTGATSQAVQVTAAASPLDSLPPQDAKSLFYGYLTDALNAPVARAGAAGPGGYSPAQQALPDQARKKAADQLAVNTIANTRAQTRPLNLGMRYSLLRKTVAGGFEPVDPNSVGIGDTLELQLMPNDSGTLQVQGRSADGAWRNMKSLSVEPLNTYTLPLKSSDTEFEVILMRRPVAPARVSLRDAKSNVSRQSTTEPATYVVAGPASPRLLFTITLHYQ